MRALALMLAGGCLVVEEVRVVPRRAPEFPSAGRPKAGLSVSLTAESGGLFYFKLRNVSGRPMLVSTDPRLFGSGRLEIAQGPDREVVRSPEAAVEADPRCIYLLAPGAALLRPMALDLALPRGEYWVAWTYWVAGEGIWTGLARSNALLLRARGGR